MSEEKDYKYYENERKDLIRLIPQSAKHVLDVGCGTGF
jgi:ubiquinone/menaquinone biosynthesis C-methylase UbiE